MVIDDLNSQRTSRSWSHTRRAASICGLSGDVSASREKRPGDFRLKELEALRKIMGDISRKLLPMLSSLFFCLIDLVFLN